MFKTFIFRAHQFLQWTFLKLIQVYRLCISPFLGNHCRFYPSCSEYALQVFHSNHIFKAFYLTCKRLLRCHPFHPGGFDSPTQK